MCSHPDRQLFRVPHKRGQKPPALRKANAHGPGTLQKCRNRDQGHRPLCMHQRTRLIHRAENRHGRLQGHGLCCGQTAGFGLYHGGSCLLHPLLRRSDRNRYGCQETALVSGSFREKKRRQSNKTSSRHRRNRSRPCNCAGALLPHSGNRSRCRGLCPEACCPLRRETDNRRQHIRRVQSQSPYLLRPGQT